jgi:ribose transport system ATP-binding protein
MQIQLKKISKSFAKNPVLKKVDFSLGPGEVHALMGENGAGKSTLMKILTGVYSQDEGQVFIDGHETKFKHAKEAEEKGIAFIHQELNIFPNLTVAENLFLGHEEKIRYTGILKTKQMEQITEEYLSSLGLSVKASKYAGSLSVGQQQMIEIAKALRLNARVIIMDEPTAALTDREIQILFSLIRKLKKQGVSFVYISHRMEEIFDLCDKITILRDGQYIATKQVNETSFDEVVYMMVGRSIGDRFPIRSGQMKADKYLEVKRLTKKGVFENISFHVNTGEILGVAGLMGAGRTEIMKAIFGYDAAHSGEIWINEDRVSIRKPTDAIKYGLSFITEDRKSEGLILDFSIQDNMVLPILKQFQSFLAISEQKEKNFVRKMIKKLNIKATNETQQVKSLSGGNQQKVVLAKWLGLRPNCLILDEPTRGVDVGAKKEIYALMQELADQGVAIVVVSSDLPEILGISDRIMVISEGKVSGFVDKQDATGEKIMNLATGGK